VSTTQVADGTLPTFHPNADRLHDKVVVSHTVSESAYLDVRVANAAGNVVKKFTVFAKAGSSTSSWAGKNDLGNFVGDGVYTLSYKPRDTAGNVGTAKSLKVVVLTSVALFLPSPGAIYSRDGDNLAQKASIPVKTNQPATVSAKVFNSGGGSVRTLQSASQLAAGSYTFMWDGRNSAGAYVANGRYSVVVTGQTAKGTYSEQQTLWVGPFRLDSSAQAPARGSKVTFTVYSTETLLGPPKIDLKQPGLASYTVSTAKVAPGKFKVTVTLKNVGSAGTLGIVVRGTDTGGQGQQLDTSLTLR
jgi:flagellar hook assembly protein FlgD